jgi:hypothetical protein
MDEIAFLNELLPDLPWQSVLETCNRTGLADKRHLQEITGLGRKPLARLLEGLLDPPSGAGFLRLVEDRVPRPIRQGRPPDVYALTDRGAAVLRAAGKTARPSGLEDPRAIAHALGMLDVALALEAQEMTLQLDRQVRFDEDRQMRPDLQVQLPEGILLLEVEQDAPPALLRRVRGSLENRWDFFETQPTEYLPQVRLIFNLRPGKAYRDAKALWGRALAMLKRERGHRAPFHLYCTSVVTFVKHPEAYARPTSLWEEITPQKPARKPARELQEIAPAPDWNGDLEAIQAMAGTLSLNPPESHLPEPPLSLFHIANIIYQKKMEATAPRGNDLLERRPPLSAVALIDLYLERHPVLRERIRNQIAKAARRRVWHSQESIRHAQRIVDTFLAYHGWYNRLMLHASVKEASAGGSMFPYEVYIQIFIAPGGPLGNHPEKALAWMLWAILAYSDDLGLGRLPYW